MRDVEVEVGEGAGEADCEGEGGFGLGRGGSGCFLHGCVVVAVLRVRVLREDVMASWPVVELGGVACNANQLMRAA